MAVLSKLLDLQAQESKKDTTYWNIGGISTLMFTQVSLTNWVAGGDNSLSLAGNFNMFANYAKGNAKWENNLVLGYGLIRQGDTPFRKTDDRINLITQYGLRISEEKLFWSSMLDFRTQFDVGLSGDGTVISRFMAPGYMVVASGLNWKPSSHFSLTYAPVTGKFTFVTDQDLANAGAFGVEAAILGANGNIITLGKKSRSELGSFVKMHFRKEIFTNVTMESRAELFSNYMQDFGNVDINLENAITMKVNDWLTVNWIIQLLYDDDINIDQFDANNVLVGSGPRTQFKSLFGVGLGYKFGAKKGA